MTAPSAPRRYYIETWGCQMNELDSQRMAGQLMQQGILPTRRPEEADIILLNSCSVREKAEQKVYSRLGQYRLLKGGKPGLLLGLCGCVAQQEGERALSRVPDLDFVIGPARVGELADLVTQRQSGQRLVATGFPAERPYTFDAIARDGAYKGMVTIIEGCNKKCTFCIVPQTRGPERSRPFDEILAEVRHLVDYGFLEIELLGQTVNHWRDPSSGADFADLLDAAARVPGVERLRFVTSYPRDFTPRMVAAVGRHPNICPYLHLPVQSGSDAVLRRMARGYSVADYRRLVDDLRRSRPGLALSTDVIVGFPGESEQEFRQTLGLVREIEFASIFAFKYSPRPGTAAPRLPDPVDPDDADRRLQLLLAEQQTIQRRQNRALEGRTLEVLITGWGREPGTLTGRSACHRVVHFPGADPGPPAADPGARRPEPPAATLVPGRLVRVRIERANPYSLIGSRVAA